MHETTELKFSELEKHRESGGGTENKHPSTHSPSKSKSSQAPTAPLEAELQPPPTPDYAAGLTPNPSVASPATPGTPLMNHSGQGSTVAALSNVEVQSSPPSGNQVLENMASPVGSTPVALTPQRIILANSQGTGGSTQTILYRTVNTIPAGYTHAELVHATPVSLAQAEVASAPTGQPQYATLQVIYSTIKSSLVTMMIIIIFSA